MGRNLNNLERINIKSIFFLSVRVIILIMAISFLIFVLKNPILRIIFGAASIIYILWWNRKFLKGEISLPRLNYNIIEGGDMSLCVYCGDIVEGPLKDPEFGTIYKCTRCGAIGKKCSKCGTLYLARKEEIEEIRGKKYECPKCGYLLMLGEKKKSDHTLKEFGRNLNEEVKRKEIVIFGRDEEIDQIIEILLMLEKNNPLLVGDAGVGKTTLVLGVCKRIVEKKVPEKLWNKRIIELRIGDLIAGTRYRGDFEERIKNILDEVKKNPNIIVFIDEIHTIVGAGSSSEQALDLSNILKPALVSGEFCCIGATTFDEYQQYIAKDKALSRRFTPVFVKELSPEATI